MNPRLLTGEQIPCLSLNVNQNLTPLSNATMEVFKQDSVPIRTLLWIETPNGVSEVYRTRQPQVNHGSDTATIQLDHAISEIGDYLIQTEIKDEKTVRDAMETVFSHYTRQRQNPLWQLGEFTATETVILDCDHDNVLETMLSILEQSGKYYLTYDFSTNPWTVSLAEKAQTVTAEGRMSRNIASAVVKEDDKDLCTRVYVKGLEGGFLDADTISIYGVVEKETGSGNLTASQALQIATEYLNAHKNPKFSIEIDGEDLSRITGETLDSFVCGKRFRLAIPEDDLVIEDYITRVSFNDALSSNQVSVTIGDDLDPTLQFLQKQASSNKSGRRSAKQQEHENEVIRSEIYATGSLLYSYVERTATYLVSVVENAESQMGSSILQTAEMIRTEVHAANSQIYSSIEQTATSIRARVEDVNADLHSEILQTQSMIRSSVWTANSLVYSYVDQTASYILDHVGERTGAKVYTGTDEPVDSPDNPITPGDLWLDGTYVNFWDDTDFKWVSYDPDDPDYDWTQLRGSVLKVWKDGKWQVAEDGTTMTEDTEFRRTKDQINLVAYNLGQFDGELKSNIARLDVKADRIVSTVNERIADVGSNITQTAYQIRSEVHSAESQLYSAIEQTATSIRSYVVDKINDVGSEILQTASQIRAEVHAANSTVYSFIDQTASYIRSEVADTTGGLSSRITQTATQIRSEVANVQQGLASNIVQTAEEIRSEVASSVSGLSSSITQNADKISIVVDDSNNLKTASIVAGINGQTGSYVTIQADKINLSGYVTASQLNATTAKIDNLMSGSTTAAWIKANQGNIPKLTVGNDLTFKSHGVYWQGVTINGTSYHFMGYVG